MKKIKEIRSLTFLTTCTEFQNKSTLLPVFIPIILMSSLSSVCSDSCGLTLSCSVSSHSGLRKYAAQYLLAVSISRTTAHC